MQDWNKLTQVTKRQKKRVTVEPSKGLLDIVETFLEEFPHMSTKGALELFMKVGAVNYVKDKAARPSTPVPNAMPPQEEPAPYQPEPVVIPQPQPQPQTPVETPTTQGPHELEV